MQSFKINSSVTDFAPFFLGLETVFRELREAQIDGVEIVVGLKSRFSSRHLRYLAEKYELPIKTLHQPIWSGLDLFFDEGFFSYAKKLHVGSVVIHPLPKVSFSEIKMCKYFQHLARMQKKYEVSILLENLPKNYNLKYIGSLFPLAEDAANMEKLYQAAVKYDFQLNLDISHLNERVPHLLPWFDQVFPRIKNIHLSSFTKKKSHLPLTMGDFDTKTFLQTLSEKKYMGFITFEIYYPGMFNFFGYNGAAIKESTAYIKSLYE